MSIKTQYEATVDDSDKTFTVPTNRAWKILYGRVSLVSTATVGNRQLAIIVADESGQIMWEGRAGAVQAASLTYSYLLQQGESREGTVDVLSLIMGIPKDLIMLPAWTIRVYDSAAVDAAADDMTVSLVYKDMNPSDTTI